MMYRINLVNSPINRELASILEHGKAPDTATILVCSGANAGKSYQIPISRFVPAPLGI
jgi:hypothetical protein